MYGNPGVSGGLSGLPRVLSPEPKVKSILHSQCFEMGPVPCPLQQAPPEDPEAVKALRKPGQGSSSGKRMLEVWLWEQGCSPHAWVGTCQRPAFGDTLGDTVTLTPLGSFAKKRGREAAWEEQRSEARSSEEVRMMSPAWPHQGLPPKPGPN